MNILDVVLLIAVFGFALAGLFFGFIHTLGSFIGTIVGFITAMNYASQVAGWLTPILGSSPVVSVIVFIVIFLVASRLVGFIFWLIQKIFNVISIIPFLSSINRLLGAVLGFAEGVVVSGAVLYYISTVSPDWLIALIGTSKISSYLLSVFSVIQNFLPLTSSL